MVRNVSYNWDANPEGHKSPSDPHDTVVVRADGTKGLCTCVADSKKGDPKKSTSSYGVLPGPRVPGPAKRLPPAAPRPPGPATRRGQKGDKAPKSKGKGPSKKQS